MSNTSVSHRGRMLFVLPDVVTEFGLTHGQSIDDEMYRKVVIANHNKMTECVDHPKLPDNATIADACKSAGPLNEKLTARATIANAEWAELAAGKKPRLH